MEVLHNICWLIQRAQRIVIATHVSPDVDAIGSLLGLGLTLERLGKQIILLCGDPVPHALAFLPGSNKVQSAIPCEFDADLIVTLDSSDTERLGEAVQSLVESGTPVANIDHHVTNSGYGMHNLVLPGCASTAELLLLLLDALDAPLSQDVATCLLAGVVGDTRSFSVAGVTPETLLAAARMVGAGANIAHVTEMTFGRRSLDTLRLWGLGLTRIRADGDVVWTVLSLEARKQAGLHDTGMSGLSSLLIDAEEANIAVAFFEQSGGQIEISFRARPGNDVATVALALGGGGHPLAAGALVEGSLDEVVRRVIGMLKVKTAQPEGEDG